MIPRPLSFFAFIIPLLFKLCVLYMSDCLVVPVLNKFLLYLAQAFQGVRGGCGLELRLSAAMYINTFQYIAKPPIHFNLLTLVQYIAMSDAEIS